MTHDQVKELLPSICDRIEENGFYAAFEVFQYYSLVSGCSKAKSIISQHIDRLNCINLVDPNCVHTLLCKFDAKQYKAFPIVSRHDFLRFFSGDWRNDICGIVLVSHKLKSLTFLYACYDIDSVDLDVSLFSIGDKSTKWAAWHMQNANDENQLLSFCPNRLHANYTQILDYKGLNSIGTFTGICFDVDDYIKDLLLFEKICAENEIEGLHASISSAQYVINNQQSKIQELNNRIDSIHSDLEKYKVNLYASRVNADLNN